MGSISIAVFTRREVCRSTTEARLGIPLFGCSDGKQGKHAVLPK